MKDTNVDNNDYNKIIGDKSKTFTDGILRIIRDVLYIVIVTIFVLTGFGLSYYFFIIDDETNFLYEIIENRFGELGFNLPDYYSTDNYDLEIFQSVSNPIIWTEFLDVLTLQNYIFNFEENIKTIDMFPELLTPSGYTIDLNVNNFNPLNLGHYEVYVFYTNTSNYVQDILFEVNFLNVPLLRFQSYTFEINDIQPNETIDFHIVFDPISQQVLFRDENYNLNILNIANSWKLGIFTYILNFQIWIYDDTFVPENNSGYYGYRVDTDDVNWQWYRINGTFNDDYINGDTNNGLIDTNSFYVLYDNSGLFFEGQIISFMFMGTELSNNLEEIFITAYESGLNFVRITSNWTLFIIISFITTIFSLLLLVIILSVIYLRNRSNNRLLIKVEKYLSKIIKKDKVVNSKIFDNIIELKKTVIELNEKYKEEISSNEKDEK